MISFGLPAALILFPIGLGVLFFAYRLRGQAKKVIVGSTFLLAQFAQKAPYRQKVKLPPRFWLELFILLLLVSILSQFILPTTTNRVAVIIDNSLSTASKISERTSVLNEIKSQVGGNLSSFNPTTTYSLFIATSGNERIDGSASEIQSKISALKIENREDTLLELLSKFSFDEFDSVTIFTDHVITAPFLSDKVKIVTIPNGQEERPNVALEKININRAGDTRIEATIRNFSHSKTISGKLRFKGIKKVGTEVSLPSGSFSISPMSSQTVSVAVQEIAFDSIEGKIIPDNNDLLEEDNVRSIAVTHEGKTFDVIGDIEVAQLGLEKVSSYTFKKGSGSVTSQYAPKIIYKGVSSDMPNTNALFVLPADVERIISDGKVTSLNERHPVMSYLSLLDLDLPQAALFNPKPWHEVLVQSAQGPVLIAGEINGHRYIFSGIELFPFDGRNSPSLSILTLNALKWLSEPTVALSTKDPFFSSESSLEDRTITITQRAFSSESTYIEAQSDQIAKLLLYLLFAFFVFDLLYYFYRKRLLGSARV